MTGKFAGFYSNTQYLYRVFINAYEESSYSLKLTFGEFIILLSIDNYMIYKQKDLVDYTYYSTSRISKIIINLVAQGFIKERSNEEGKKHYVLTASGKEIKDLISIDLSFYLKENFPSERELKAFYYNLCLKENIEGDSSYSGLYTSLHKLYYETKTKLPLKDYDLSHSQYIFAKLVRKKPGINQRTIAKQMGFSIPRTNQLTKSLIEKGLLVFKDVYYGQRLKKELYLTNQCSILLGELDKKVEELFINEYEEDAELFSLLATALRFIEEKTNIEFI